MNTKENNFNAKMDDQKGFHSIKDKMNTPTFRNWYYGLDTDLSPFDKKTTGKTYSILHPSDQSIDTIDISYRYIKRLLTIVLVVLSFTFTSCCKDELNILDEVEMVKLNGYNVSTYTHNESFIVGRGTIDTYKNITIKVTQIHFNYQPKKSIRILDNNINIKDLVNFNELDLYDLKNTGLTDNQISTILMTQCYGFPDWIINKMGYFNLLNDDKLQYSLVQYKDVYYLLLLN